MKKAKISFEMKFDNKYSDEDIRDFIRYNIGSGHCTAEISEQYGDLEAEWLQIDIV